MTAEDIRALIARRNQAVIHRNSPMVMTAYSDDCVVESPLMGTLAGRTAIQKSFELFWVSFPDVSYEFDEPLIAGDRVVQTLFVRGTNTGGLLGQAPTGKLFRFFVVLLFNLRNCQIVHERRVYDFSGLLRELAGEAGHTEESAKLYGAILSSALLDQEIRIAADIQQSLLPPSRYRRLDLEVAAASVPCRAIGGDFFDYFDLPNRMFGFVLGDIAGKGPPAALLAGIIQGFLAGHAQLNCNPAETLTQVNQVLLRRTIESRFATVVYGVLTHDGHLTYCNAGHNPPFLIGRGGSYRLQKGGLILGVFDHATYEEEELHMSAGDILVTFSDGITETVNCDGEEFGDQRLESIVQSHLELSPGDLLDRILAEVRRFSAGAPQGDDLTALILRRSGAPRIVRKPRKP